MWVTLRSCLFLSSAGSSVSTQNSCPPGTYCSAGSSTTTACPSGSYSLSANIASSSGCVVCPYGYYCTSQTAAGVACAAGKYQPFTGQTALAACLTCPPGFYQSAAGQTTCKICAAGTYWYQYVPVFSEILVLLTAVFFFT
jgi:hypothetical protein